MEPRHHQRRQAALDHLAARRVAERFLLGQVFEEPPEADVAERVAQKLLPRPRTGVGPLPESVA